jgi:DNA-binding NarL/FixJ family response regulator
LKKQKKPTDSASDVFIHIIGSNMLQNELLLSFMKDKIGLKGKCLSKLDPECLTSESESEQSNFFLFDCKGINMENFWNEINSLNESKPSQCFIVLCNVDPKTKTDKIAMGHGIEGVFYDNDPLQTIPKGIVSILNGDLWYSRKTMTKFLLEPKPLSKSSENSYANDLLTPREKEVLTLIALGHNSKKMADMLCISTHTVKTHIYNIYNKINTTNRLQATLWAAKHL